MQGKCINICAVINLNTTVGPNVGYLFRIRVNNLLISIL